MDLTHIGDMLLGLFQHCPHKAGCLLEKHAREILLKLLEPVLGVHFASEVSGV